MTPPTRAARVQSWIKPDFVWVNPPDSFVTIVRTDSSCVVELISNGTLEVALSGNRNVAAAMSALMGSTTLRGQLHEAVWDPTRLRPRDWRGRKNGKVIAYFVAAFLLPDKKNIGIVVSRSKAAATGDWLSAECKAKADELLQNHKIAVVAFDEGMRVKEEREEEFYSRSEILPYKNAAISQLAAEKANRRPILTPEELLPFLPRAIVCEVTGNDQELLTKRAIAAIAAAGLRPSRDGSYIGIVTTRPRGLSRVIVTWTPHLGLPSYPEIRAAVQRRAPSAFHTPRQIVSGRPELGSAIGDVSAPLSFGDELGDIFRALDDLRLYQPDASSRAHRLREDLDTRGLEAIAWYQAYHVWTEETWGIYFDATKLDDLAYSIFEDLRSNHLAATHSSAAFLAFGLTQAHEMFHARVEAATSWLELNVLQGRHLRYNTGVYEALRNTPEWIEEALANWSAWDWFSSSAVQSLIASRLATGGVLDRVIKTLLDLSPPGYRDWRKGADFATRRAFVTQLTSGRPKLPPPGIGLPLDSVIDGPLPYDFRSNDIPLRFIGTGVIADWLLSRPASFNVPTRRELEKALKHFKHAIEPSGGKGGHQKWTGPDQRAFILPTRDPVSPGVFKTFLHHIGIDKATYVHQIRPNL